MKKVALTGIVGYALLGFLGWNMLRGVYKVFIWSLESIDPYVEGPVVFGFWETVGAAVLSAALGWVIVYVYKDSYNR